MNPLWIIDFSSNEVFKKQIENLRSAIKLPGREWLKYSTYSGESSEDSINENDCVKKGQALFFEEYFQGFNRHDVQTSSGNEPTFLFDIHFIIDIRKHETHEALFKIINNLKHSKFVETPNKYFYLHLWLPDGLDLTDRVQESDTDFLNLLHNFQNQKLFFDHVLIYSSIESKEKKDDAFVQIFNGINLISVGSDSNSTKSIFNSQFTHIQQEKRFLLCEALSIYHEKDVFIEQQSYILGDILLKAFKDNNEKPFVDNEKVNDVVLNSKLEKILDPNLLNHEITSDFLSPDKPQNKINPSEISDRILVGFKQNDSKTKPLDKFIWNPSKLLNGFYLRFLFTIKKNLINEIQQAIQWKWEDFKKNIDEKARVEVAKTNKILDDKIFSIFDYQNPAKECSLQQALKINERIEQQSKDILGKFDSEKSIYRFKELSNDDNFAYFPMTDKFKNALETVNLTYAGLNSKEKQKEIVSHIETIVKNYPIVWWAQFTRVLLSVFCLVLVTGPIIGLFNSKTQSSFTDIKYIGIGAFLSLFPLILFWWKNRQRKQVLISMVNQYIAVTLEELNEKALIYNRSKVSEYLQMVCSYLEWVKNDKIKKRLIGGINLQKPKDFSFTSSESFQPLFTIPVDVEDVSNDSLRQKDNLTSIQPASFGSPKITLFDDLSQIATKVNCRSGNITLFDLIKDNDKKVDILQELMQHKVKVNNLYSDATIHAEPKLNILLLLDVSGSMRGQNFDKLKEVVLKLKVNHQDNLSWIAFSNEAKTDKESNDNIPELFGYTNLKSAFDKALEMDATSFDKVILVSDGLPTTSTGHFLSDFDRQKLCQDAFSINKPLDVIYIGNDDEGKTFMKALAEITGGRSYEQSIDSLDEKLAQSMKIKYDVVSADENKTFSELLQMGHTDGCNSAIKIFCINKLSQVSNNIEEYLEFNGASKEGMVNLLRAATMLPHSLNSSSEKPYLIYKFNDGASIENWITNHKNNSGLVTTLDFSTDTYYENINIFNSIVGIRPLGGLENLNTEDKLKEKINFSKNDAWDLLKDPENIKGEKIEINN